MARICGVCHAEMEARQRKDHMDACQVFSKSVAEG